MAASVDFSKLFVREYECHSGAELQFFQSEVGDVGCVVWDAALVLARYLETDNVSKRLEKGRGEGEPKDVGLKDCTVVELGAGTGAVGLVAASLGASVTVTDLPDFVPLMEHNIRENQQCLKGRMEAAELTWGARPGEDIPNCPDLVLMADCIYYEESLDPLVNTMEALSGATTTIFCCFEKRDTGNKPELERKFFELVQAKFDAEEIPLQEQDPHFSSEDIHIFEFRLKKTST